MFFNKIDRKPIRLASGKENWTQILHQQASSDKKAKLFWEEPVKYIEQCRRVPSLQMLIRICLVLNLNLSINDLKV